MIAITIKMKELRKDIDKIIDKYLQEVVKIVLLAIKNYPTDWDKYYDKIENLFYEFLEKVYNLVINYLNQIYEKLPDFSVEDIFDLAYDIDGKKITERLREYWDEAAEKIKQENNNSNNHINVQNYLINMYDRILFTESRVVESKIKEFKKPTNASMLIIESGCENCIGGEYPPDEDIQLPPFHPNCNCTHYYEITDDEDDINDLDLEIEE